MNQASSRNGNIYPIRRRGSVLHFMPLAHFSGFLHNGRVPPTAHRAADQARIRCLSREMAEIMAVEPTLEAVTVPNGEGTIAIATMGRDLPAELEEKVTQAVTIGVAEGKHAGCGLLAGSNDCKSCPQPIAKAEKSGIEVKRTNSGATFARITCPTAPRFWRWRRIPLPRLVPREVELPDDHDGHDHHHEDEWKWQLLAAGLCGVLGLVAAFGANGDIRLALFVAAYLAGAWFAAEETWERLRRGAIDVHFLMLAVAAGSATIGAWGEGVTLLFLFSLSGALEHYALGRTQREIRSLFKDAPKTALVVADDGSEKEVEVEHLRPGMRLALKPDAQFPVDGRVVKGSTAADESTLSGESAPVEKTVGDDVLAGTLNLWGAVQVEVTRPAAESALQRVIQLIREAQRSKAPSQRLTDRFGSAYTVGVLLLTLIMFFVWWQAFGLAPFVSTGELKSAFYRAMTLLVVASPCALVLSIPSAILAAIASGARQGILFRGGAAVEQLADVNVVALDKTGTITTGELTVESVESHPAEKTAALELVASSIARHSHHPLSRAIAAHARRQGWPATEIDHLESIAGQGISARMSGQLCLLGRRDLLESLGDDSIRQLLKHLPASPAAGLSRPEVWIAGPDFVGVIQLRDDIRPQAAHLLQRLNQLRLKTVLLTGDRHANAAAIQQQLHLDEVRAELRPDDKLKFVLQQNEGGHRVAMIGDGVNDAPGLAAAHVGVAMGARGSDAALEQADVVLMHDRLENFLAAFQISQRAKRIIQQNLFVSLGTVVVLVAFALAGQIPLTLGVLGHEGSTVIVVMNSLRLLLNRGATGPANS